MTDAAFNDDESLTRSEDERRESRNAQRRRWRAENPKKVAEQRRRWRVKNPEKVAQYRSAYKRRARDRDPEKYRSDRREQQRRVARRRQQREQRNATSRRRYAVNLEESRARSRDYTRRYTARQKAADPEAFRARKNTAQREWVANHRDRLNARRREQYRQNPEQRRATSRAYAEKNRDQIREKRRAYYRANRERVLESNRRYKEREKRRVNAGLPARRIHSVSAAERDANQAAADEFFARPRSVEELDALQRTPPDQLAQWARDSERARALHARKEDAQVRDRVEREMAARLQAEEERMDAIARDINNKLRGHPRRPAVHLHPTQPQLRGPGHGL